MGFEVTKAPDHDEWQVLVQQADIISKSGLAPSALRNKPEAILTIALKGREVGVPPMQALSHIHIIQGRPSMSAELMRALVQQRGHRIWTEYDPNQQVAKCSGQRYNFLLGEYEEHIAVATFSMEDAKRAGITGKDNWKKYPRAMLVARATSVLVREHFADVAMGVSYTPEELDPDLRVDEGGYVLDAAPLPPAAASLPAAASSPVVTGTPTEPGPDTASSAAAPTKGQYAKAHAILGENNIDEELYRAALRKLYDVNSFKELTRDQMTKVLKAFESKEKVQAFAQAGLDQLEDEMVETTSVPNSPEES